MGCDGCIIVVGGGREDLCVGSGIGAGADKVGNIAFTVQNDEPYKTLAGQQAVKEARKKADQLAASAGTAIKGIVSIQEAEQPVAYPMQSFMRAEAKGAAPTPVMSGESEIETTVSITYSIKE